jgi:hypothetical protein
MILLPLNLIICQFSVLLKITKLNGQYSEREIWYVMRYKTGAAVQHMW